MDAFAGLAQVLSAKEEVLWKVDGRIWLLHLMMCYRNIQVRMGAKKHFGDSLKRLHHVMFRYHDVKTKDASMAWKHLQKGNEYKMSVLPPFDKRFEQQCVQMVKQIFAKKFFPKGIGSKTRTPIFIIGFVQSGSTLLERILDAHPLLVGAGEDSVFNGSLDYILNEIVAANQAGDLSILHRKVKKLADDVVIDMIKRWEI